ncbi:sugar ABC transporter substrate-binding protein [Deinococcus gobiensis]|nr:extracellular solute-binding protein [Deinococcus gobiensis]
MPRLPSLALLTLTLIGTAHAAPLTVWTHYQRADANWLRAQAALYTRRTGQPVQIRTLPLDQLGPQWAAAGAGGPDVVVGVPDEWLLQVRTLAAPLTPAGPQDRAGIQAFTLGGRTLGLPLMAEAMALVYNPRLVSAPPTTWKALTLELARQVKLGRQGLVLDLTDPYTQAGLFRAYGADVFGPQARSAAPATWGLAQPGALKAAERLRQWGPALLRNRQPERRGGGPGLRGGPGGDVLAGPWELPVLQQAGLEVRSVPFPVPEDAPQGWQPFVGRQAVMVSARSVQRKEGAALAGQLSSDAAQVALYRAGGRLPSSPAAWAQLADTPELRGFGQAIRAGAPVPARPEMDAVWDPWQAALGAIQTQPQRSVREILGAAVQTISAALGR